MISIIVILKIDLVNVLHALKIVCKRIDDTKLRKGSFYGYILCSPNIQKHLSYQKQKNENSISIFHKIHMKTVIYI